MGVESGSVASASGTSTEYGSILIIVWCLTSVKFNKYLRRNVILSVSDSLLVCTIDIFLIGSNFVGISVSSLVSSSVIFLINSNDSSVNVWSNKGGSDAVGMS